MGKPRGIFTKQIRVNLDHATHTELAVLAQRQGGEIGAVARSLIEASLQSAQGARPLTEPAPKASTGSQPDTRVVASLASFGATLNEIVQRLHHTDAALDELALSYFLHTPEISKEQQGASFASGSRRHTEFHGRVTARLSTRGKK